MGESTPDKFMLRPTPIPTYHRNPSAGRPRLAPVKPRMLRLPPLVDGKNSIFKSLILDEFQF